MSDLPKVLIISHCVISKTTNNGKTLYSFFNGWDEDKIAEIYLNPEIPDSRICKKYFRITDMEIINSIIKKKTPGRQLDENDIVESLTNNRTTNARLEKVHNYARKRKPYMYLLRNLMWSLNRWNTEELNEWIDGFDPDIVFYVAGSFSYSYKIALNIAHSRGIPLVPYFSDDHYIMKQRSFSPIYWINRMSFRRTMESVLQYSPEYMCICDEMNEAYTRIFKKKGNTLMTPATLSGPFKQQEDDSVFRISYIGNLNFNRWKPLIEIGTIIDSIRSQGTNVEFAIYSGTTDTKVISRLRNEKGIDFKGKIGYHEVLDVIKKSDLLVHVESFDKCSRKKTEYSISTKIPDSLMSGRCVFAYGPREVASIRYLSKNGLACVVSEPELLERNLIEIVTNSDLRDAYIRRALRIGSINHSPEGNRTKIKHIFSKASKSQGRGQK